MRWHRREPEPEPAHEDDPELLDAEALAADLSRRAQKVVAVLRPRHERNHWQEAVEQMIYAKGTRP